MTKQTLAFALLFAISTGEAVWIGLLIKNKPCTQYWRVEKDRTYWHSCDGIHYVEVPTAADTTTIIQQQSDGSQPCSNIVAQGGNVNVECNPDMKGKNK